MNFKFIVLTLIAADTLILLSWLYLIWFPGSGADPAGKGLGVVYTLGLAIYILIGLGFMYVHTVWALSIAAVMASVPIIITVYGVWLWLKTRRRE